MAIEWKPRFARSIHREMVADEMPDTLEKLYPEENPPPKQKAQEEFIAKKDEEIQQGYLFG